jgi:hypothetical protein
VTRRLLALPLVLVAGLLHGPRSVDQGTECNGVPHAVAPNPAGAPAGHDDARKPTHASPHLKLPQPDGCDGRSLARSEAVAEATFGPVHTGEGVKKSGGAVAAQDPGCTLPANPGGSIGFSLEPPEYDVGTDMGWSLDFDQPDEMNYAIDIVYEVDGPDGHHTIVSQSGRPLFTVPAEGAYTVSAHWTESCADGVTPDRTVSSRPATFKGVGPRPPFGSVELRQGGARLPGGKREPATALLHVGCPASRLDEPLRVTARIAGRTIVIVRPHGCLGYTLSRSAARHSRRWQMNADDFGARIFVSAPATLTGHFELRSGDRVIASANVRFRPNAHGRERVSVLRPGCLLGGGCPGR